VIPIHHVWIYLKNLKTKRIVEPVFLACETPSLIVENWQRLRNGFTLGGLAIQAIDKLENKKDSRTGVFGM